MRIIRQPGERERRADKIGKIRQQREVPRTAQIDPRVVGDAALNRAVQQDRTGRAVLRHQIEIERELVIAVNQIRRQRDSEPLLTRVAAQVTPELLQRTLFIHRQVVEEGVVERHAQQRLILVNPALRRETVADLQGYGFAIPQVEVRRGAEGHA